MLKKLGIFEIDADVSKKYDEHILKQVEDEESLKLLASMGIKKMFKGEMFYHAIRWDYFMGRTATFNLIGTIDNKIYKVYFKFLDDDRAACIAFRDEIREYLSENMTAEQFRNPKITKREDARLSTWHFDWGNILLEEFGVLTETGTIWNTAIASTSNAVKGAKRIGPLDRLFNRV